MQLQELEQKYIDKIPKELKKKFLDYHQGNISFYEAAEKKDLTTLRFLLNKDYPVAFSIFSQEEQYLIGDDLSDTWDSNIYYIAQHFLHKQGIKKESQELIDLLAEYWMYQHSPWYHMRKVYFSCSTDVKKSLSYATHLYESMNFLHSEKNEWITGAMCHGDNGFFDEFFEIHKKHDNYENIFWPLFKTDRIQKEDNACYNFKSWCKYYNYYLERAINERLSRPYYNHLKGYTKEDAINEIFCDLYQTFDSTKEKQFIDFLNEEYKYFFDIDNPDFIKVSLAWTAKKENDIKEHLRETTSRRPRRPYYIRDNKEDILVSAVSYAIQNNCADECEKVFKKIHLDESYYKHLSSYLQLDNQLHIKLLTMEKLQKI